MNLCLKPLGPFRKDRTEFVVEYSDVSWYALMDVVE